MRILDEYYRLSRLFKIELKLIIVIKENVINLLVMSYWFISNELLI